jgi:hypothetical protein
MRYNSAMRILFEDHTMLTNHFPKLPTLVLIWLGWALVLTGYQRYALARFQPQVPDDALLWTANETLPDSQADKPPLNEPFLNDHVSWDSEYYISIAADGYDDPTMRAIPDYYTWELPMVSTNAKRPDWVSMNHAFFPLYPYVMKGAMVPLSLFGLNDLATATLAGVLVSMLGTLGAMIALYDLARTEMGESTGLRAAFYLLIWPAGMFLAQVYTEGLFLGLSFGALTLARRRRWLWAGLLAACATWTRAGGALLLLPLLWYWWYDDDLGWIGPRWFRRERLKGKIAPRALLNLALACSPLIAYLIWNALLGEEFHIVESRFFSRGLLLINQSREGWRDAWDRLRSDNLQARAYFMVEFLGIAFGYAACLLMLLRRNYRIIAVYSLLAITFSLTSGSAQGMHRYVMAAPVIFLLPARWGRYEAFDRVWTLLNVLVMGIFAIMFSADFWAG